MIQTSPRYLLELTMVGFLVLFVISLVSFKEEVDRIKTHKTNDEVFSSMKNGNGKKSK